MAASSFISRLDRDRLGKLADWLMVTVAVSLPWSTSATGILLVLWLVAFIPTLTWPELRREVISAAGGLPTLLVLLGIFGMAWAEVGWQARWGGLTGFAKLLVIPLVMAQYRRSNRDHWVFIGFLVACVAMLIASWVVTIWPNIPKPSIDPGVPVKTYILQSAEFAMCAVVLLHLAFEQLLKRRWLVAAGQAALALAFLSDIFFITTSRTTLFIIPTLILGYGFWRFGRKGLLGAAAVGLIASAALWMTSPYLRQRVESIASQTEAYEIRHQVTSAGERLVFWQKSISFIRSAPLFGHGTGSITDQFRRAAVGHGVRGIVATNPHNQTFAVGIQLGILGIVVLWGMWIAQSMMFWRFGLTAWIGLVIVIQNVVGSLFNSFLFDFTEGWIYVVGVGVAVGTIQREIDFAGSRRSEIATTSAPKT